VHVARQELPEPVRKLPVVILHAKLRDRFVLRATVTFVFPRIVHKRPNNNNRIQRSVATEAAKRSIATSQTNVAP
jgi:hypothetical protein